MRALSASPLLSLVLALGVMGCDGCGKGGEGSKLPAVRWKLPEGGARTVGGLRVGRRVPEALARRPRFSRRKQPPGLRCAPDGVLSEWRAIKALTWITARPLAKAADYTGPKDQAAKIAMASYSGGLSLAVLVDDDIHIPAKASAAFDYADAVELELWPTDVAETKGRPELGTRLWLGSFKRLVRYDKPKERWREGATQAFGSEIGGGWQVEARLPLSVLTPLVKPTLTSLRYRITIHDRDKGKRGRPTLRAEGTLPLTPKLQVPEGVQRRGSMRVCMADVPKRAVWGYRNGWRCSIPYRPHRQPEDDLEAPPPLRFDHARLPKPPLLRYLRERLLLLNYPKLRRGVAGLLDMDKRLVSLLDLGIVGAQDPGNARTKTSDAEPLRLPDGTWAVAVTHARPHRSSEQRDAQSAPPFGARCAGGFKVYLSIIALRGAPHVTPHKHVPKPDPPPKLAEVLRVQLEDCEASLTYDWSISRDRNRVTLRDSVDPRRPARTFTYDRKEGVYKASSRKKP